MLIDSNIMTTAAKPGNIDLARFLYSISRSVSVITYIESFGFHPLSETEMSDLTEFFALCEILPLADKIAEQAIALRQQRRMGLGEAIIAATAMTQSLSLVTHNSEDFRWITGLHLLDPLAI